MEIDSVVNGVKTESYRENTGSLIDKFRKLEVGYKNGMFVPLIDAQSARTMISTVHSAKDFDGIRIKTEKNNLVNTGHEGTGIWIYKGEKPVNNN